jgi:MYXO-CTERM domain-containing protein
MIGFAVMIRRRAVMAAFILAGVCRSAAAGVEDWEVNEIVVSAGGDSAVRYIELVNLPGGCLFPTSRVTSYDAGGAVVDTQSLVAGTTCFGADTYYLIATSAAKSLFDTDADVSMAPLIPAAAGQVCFISSSTRYDCVRWGSITTPVVDFFGAADTTEAPAPGDGIALERIATTHVVEDDWALDAPTPRGPNDGTPWSPPDAGPTPDAFPPPDAGPDAGPEPDAWILPDARPVFDANPQGFLDLEAGGGAACSCTGGTAAPGTFALLLAAGLLATIRTRRRRRCAA